MGKYILLPAKFLMNTSRILLSLLLFQRVLITSTFPTTVKAAMTQTPTLMIVPFKRFCIDEIPVITKM